MGEQAEGGPKLAALLAGCAGFFEMRHQHVCGVNLVLTSASLTLICRLRWPWRFNLRRLFIAVTLLAVVLEKVAWLDYGWIGK
jgi:hypothetical protein